jgi:hypothetical protein
MKAIIAMIPEININIMLDWISSPNQEERSRMSSMSFEEESLSALVRKIGLSARIVLITVLYVETEVTHTDAKPKTN